MKVAHIYSMKTDCHRRSIVDDDGDIEIGKSPSGEDVVICNHPNGQPGYFLIMPGEYAVVADSDTVPANERNVDALMRRANPRASLFYTKCALVNADNMVEGIILAELGLDDSPHPDWTMVECYSPMIIIGCTYDPASGLFTMPEGLIPPGAPGNNEGTEPIIVQPYEIPKP